jgi:hypothetical protein
MKSLIVSAALLSSALGGLTVGKSIQTPELALTANTLEILKHFSLVDLDDGQGGVVKTIRITGVNVQIVNGLGATNGNANDPFNMNASASHTNGAGNLIIGYDEPLIGIPVNRTGSHYLVVGPGHTFSGFGGAVVGSSNASTAPYASVYAGAGSKSTGVGACITGGNGNLAGGAFSSVTGGFNSSAAGEVSSVGGGLRNFASGPYATVSGGYKGQASGEGSSVSGGDRCAAQGRRSSVSGGSVSIAAGDESWAAGDLVEDQ